MRLSFSIAVRFLRSSLTQTIIIILGIGIGVSVQIFIGSLINGLQKSLIETTIGNSAHISVTPTGDKTEIRDYEVLIRDSVATDTRITEASPVFDAAALLDQNGKSQSLLVRGFDFKRAEGIYKLTSYITEGALPARENEVMLGVKVRDDFGLSIGDTVTLITPDRKTVDCTVSGFFDYKVSQINKSWCVTMLPTAQKLFGKDDVVTAVEFQVAQPDVFAADAIADKIRSAISDNSLDVTNWKAQNGQLLSGLQGQSISSLMIQVFVMISVSLGIASVLAITVMQKSRQVGILKAMGIKNSSSSLIFLFEGLILGIFGAVTGILLGLGLALSFTQFAVKPDGTPVVALLIDPSFIGISGAIAIGACILASLIPARKSSALQPIDIIRNS